MAGPRLDLPSNLQPGTPPPKVFVPSTGTQIDNNVNDIQPVGTAAAAGNRGLAADAKHAHALDGSGALSNATPQPINITPTSGVDGVASRDDHVHLGVSIRATEAFNSGVSGPAPISISFTLSDGQALLVGSGTAIKTTAIGFFNIEYQIDGTTYMDLSTYTNSFGVHWTGIAGTVRTLGLATGSHTAKIQLTQGVGSSSSDGNDRFSIEIIEFRRSTST